MTPIAPIMIARTGAANVASVRAMLQRLDVEATVTSDAAAIATAPAVILPGVGSFGAAMSEIEPNGIARAIRDRVTWDRPLLAICLGLQLLAESSEESPGVNGLGVLPTRVTRFPEPLRAPHFGWNMVTSNDSGGLIEPGYAYFANSYRLTSAPPGWYSAWTDYGGPFVAAIERGNVLACQFHPELSGPWGQSLIERWLRRAGVQTC